MALAQKNFSDSYYDNKISILADIFGNNEISISQNSLCVGEIHYPIIDDVIVLLNESEYPTWLSKKLNKLDNPNLHAASDVQFSFGEEWKSFPEILPEHEQEFKDYFDIVPQDLTTNKRVCDLGCGIGRWSYFLKDSAREVILVDFSEAIFVARNNLRSSTNALFFLGDLRFLPFRNNFADFVLCLGVLHHLPIDCLQASRLISRYSDNLLIYLYYALDNRPLYFQMIWKFSDYIRKCLCRFKSPTLRFSISWIITLTVYIPFVYLGKLLSLFNLDSHVPLYESHKNDSLKRICQDCYDRFFTSIEQRVSRKQILTLQDTYNHILIGDNAPYWHFLCQR